MQGGKHVYAVLVKGQRGQNRCKAVHKHWGESIVWWCMKYDYIISGAGCAGLSLAYHLTQGPKDGKRILILDKDEKATNDRTWCFWEKGKGPFEPLLHHSWDELYFMSPAGVQLMDIAPYQYKMIRGIDFYEYVKAHLAGRQEVEWVQTGVERIEDGADGATVVASTGTKYEGRYVFNSIFLPQYGPIDRSKHPYMAQHFGGWVIRTEAPTFEPHRATLMDFRIAQNGETRFMYCLPTDAHTALVEATIFSNALLDEQGYDAMIEAYFEDFLPIKGYSIAHKEYGIIPMTTFPFHEWQGNRVVQIGTMAGHVKASTGYAFTRIQKQTQRIAAALQAGKRPAMQPTWRERRYAFFDRVLLNVMLNRRVPTHVVFSRLFGRNRPSRVLRFLNEETQPWEEFLITNSAPKLPFMAAALDEMTRGWRQR